MLLKLLGKQLLCVAFCGLHNLVQCSVCQLHVRSLSLLFWVKDSFPLEKGKKKTSNDLTSVDFFFLFPQTFCSEFQDREFITNAFCSDLGVEKMSGKSEIWGYCKY